MRLNAAIALQGLSTHELEVEDVIERIRYLLNDIEPNAYVGVELLSVGTDFGLTYVAPSLEDLLASGERLRLDLLRRYWCRRDPILLLQSLRLGHVLASMNPTRVRRTMDEILSSCDL
jgi:hypothetical protein